MIYVSEEMKVLDSKTADGIKIEILEYPNLQGAGDPSMAENLYFSQRSGIKLRQVKITLVDSQSEVVTEIGALQYLKGRIKQENKVGGLGGLAKKILGTKLNQEDLFRPSYVGRGEVFLEPSFKHFTIIQMDDADIVLDKNMFYCASKNLDITLTTTGNLSSAFLGTDGVFQTRVKGTGLLVVEIPVSFGELIEVDLKDEILQIDGNIALMREASVKFTVRTSTKNIFRTVASGEGLVETYTGDGKVWLAPTLNAYDQFLNNTQGNRIN
jgi:uncharacterized protein (AIM24 family)